MPPRNRKTPGKTTVKKMARERDGYQCTQCHISNDECLERHGRSLDVHRLVPGSRYTLEGCVTLCAECHGPQPRRPHGQRVLDGFGFHDDIVACLIWASKQFDIPPIILLRRIVGENIATYIDQAKAIRDARKTVREAINGTE